MPIAPWYIGQTRPKWQLTWTDDSGNPIDLSTATVTVRLKAQTTASDAAGQGQIVVTNAAGGVFTYAPVVADFSRADVWQAQFTATYGDGTVLYSDPIGFAVQQPI